MGSTVRRTRTRMRVFVTSLVPFVTVLGILLLAPAAAAQGDEAGSADQILQAAGVRDGITACEIGAGDGTLTVAAARAVGAAGRVYSSELGERRVKALQDAVEASGLAQITVVAGDGAATNFPAGACDALFMRDVYHHFGNPAAMNAAIFAAVAPGARVAIVDFTPSGKEAASPAARDDTGTHGVSPEAVTREMQEAGFEPVSSQRGRRWFIVVLQRPTS